MKAKYTPFYSLLRYAKLKSERKVAFENKNMGHKETVNGEDFTVFREIYLCTNDDVRKEGNAVFRVVFSAPKLDVKKVIRRTNLTIPFFSGLPGFCNKQFFVNREHRTFSGKYEWETTDDARNYAASFAVRFMKRRSKPYPLSYKIIDKKTGNIVEEKTLN